MFSAIGLALFGLLLGIRHAVDPDHVVAVTAIASAERSIGRASRIGAIWGIGHTLTILIVGGAIIGFRIAIPPRLGLAFEFAVGIALILLGLANVFRPDRELPGPRDARPFVVGMVHGLAGSAAVALLVLAAVPDARWGVAYLLLFGLGTVLGMAGVTTAIAVPASLLAQRVSTLRRYLVVATGAASIVFGTVIAVQLAASGLFSGTPVWTPR